MDTAGLSETEGFVLVGYARVSTLDQETDLQFDALRKAGVTKIYSEKVSSVSARPQLQLLLVALQPGDQLIVYKLDRLARSLKDLLAIIERLEAVGCGFRSLTEPIDNTTPAGMLMLQMLGAVAQFERTLIRERSIAGQVAALRRGARIGRPRKFTEDQDREVFQSWKAGASKKSLMRLYNASNTTIDLAIEKFEPSGKRKRQLRPILGPLLSQADLPRPEIKNPAEAGFLLRQGQL